ncbi:MAG: amidohydrolase family protein [Polyangiaceae bacterium]
MTSERSWVASERVALPDEEGGLRIAAACVAIDGPHLGEVEVVEDLSAAVVARRSAGQEVRDYGARLVTPAFINAHAHLSLGMLRGFDMRRAARGNMVEELFFALETRITPDDIRAFTRMGAYESLLHGVGLVWDHYYAGEVVAEALAEVGLAGVVAPTLQDLAGPGAEVWEAQLAATTRIDERADLAERGVVAALGPHATDTVSDRLWGAALEVAQARNLPLHAHLAQSPEEVARLDRRHALSPTAWLERLGVLSEAPSAVFAHAIYVSRGDLATLAARGSHLCWCPMSAMVFGFPARVGLWEAMQVGWAVGTDCASNNDGMNVQQELRSIAAQRTVGGSWTRAYQAFLDAPRFHADLAARAWDARSVRFSEHEALATPESLLGRVWSIPGRMHPKLRAGVIAPGALANLLIWDLEHPALWPALDPLHTLAMADATKAIHGLIVAGREVGEAGRFHQSVIEGERYAEARREAQARLDELLARIGV